VNVPTRLTALALGASLALALAGCSSSGQASATADGDRLKVVATTTQLTDFAAQVGGDDIELTGLLQPGGSAHHFDPSPADLLTLGSADVLIVNGAGLDEFVDGAIESSGFNGTVIDASEGIDPELAKQITREGEGGDAHEHAHESNADEHDHDHGDHEEGDHDHDHGDLNPHLWTSPRFAEGMVSMIAGDLARVDPDHADDYTSRADAYVAQLRDLDAWISAQYERVPEPERVLVTGHDSMRYYLHDYDIAFAGSLLPSFDDNAEPSAAEIDALVDAIKHSGVKAIFVESSLSPKLAQTVANEAGVQVIDADSLYVDSLGPTGSGADTYLAATVHNTRVILEAWGATVDPVPAELGVQ